MRPKARGVTARRKIEANRQKKRAAAAAAFTDIVPFCQIEKDGTYATKQKNE